MKKLRNRAIVILAVVGLFASSAVAMAEEGEEETTGDTVFNFAYNPELKVFVWGYSSTDGELDCSLEDGEYEADFSFSDENATVDQLSDEGEPVTFPVREDEEADPVEYTADGECGLGGGTVSGPAGQVNHGMFLRLFNAWYDGEGGRGCLVRHIARSSLGMGDQQVKPGDVDPDAEPVGDTATGTLDLTSVLTKCVNGNGNGNGRPEWAGKPDGAGKPEGGNGNGHGRPEWAGKPGGPGGSGKPGGPGSDD